MEEEEIEQYPGPVMETIRENESNQYIYKTKINKSEYINSIIYNNTENLDFDSEFKKNVPLESKVSIVVDQYPDLRFFTINSKYKFTVPNNSSFLSHFVPVDTTQDAPRSLGGKKPRRSRKYKYRKNKKHVSRKYKNKRHY